MNNQPKNVYVNSECEVCKIINSRKNPLKLKENPLTDTDIIICKDCFGELYLKRIKD